MESLFSVLNMTTFRTKAEEDRIKLANIFEDTNHDARFESMRKNTRSARVLRRHEDLRKQCEKEVRTYERWQKLAAAELRQVQTVYLDRLKKFQKSLSQPGFHSSRVIVANLCSSPREEMSAPSVPHYVRYRGASKQSNNKQDLPDVEKLDSCRTSSSVKTYHGGQQTPDGLKLQAILTPREPLTNPARLSPALSSEDIILEKISLSPRSCQGSPRRMRKDFSGYSSQNSARSGTSLPKLTPRVAFGPETEPVYKIGNSSEAEVTEIRDLRHSGQNLLFSVRKENGQETYVRNKKKTVSFTE